jgi:hypothetical protein
VEETNMKSDRETKIEAEPAAVPPQEEITLQWVREQTGNRNVERRCAALDNLLPGINILEKSFLLGALLTYREGHERAERPAEKFAVGLIEQLSWHPMSPKDIDEAMEFCELDWTDAVETARYMQCNYPQVFAEAADQAA